jgi:hypothetical protein
MLRPVAMVGRAPEQVDRFIADRVDPLLDRYKDEIEAISPGLKV